MNTHRLLLPLLILPFLVLPANLAAARLTEAAAQELGAEAYLYGYPLVALELMRKVMTNVSVAGTKHAPLGQFAQAESYPIASFREVSTPNMDLLRLSAWLDLAKEPYILHVPAQDHRYYQLSLMSTWGNIFATVGTRTGGAAKDYVLTGPKWRGVLPENLIELKSPTNIVWILGGIYCTGTPEDLTEVHALQQQYSLTPLYRRGRKYQAPLGKTDPKVNMLIEPSYQVQNMNSTTFFSELARLMKSNPPAVEDGPILAKIAQIGLIPGRDFAPKRLDLFAQAGITRSPRRALEKIATYQKDLTEDEKGWEVSRQQDNETDYLHRTTLVLAGLGTTLPQDLVTTSTKVDDTGSRLAGASAYILHFDADNLPPTHGFWSLTLYDEEGYLFANRQERYLLSDLQDLVYNKDGSLDVYIQVQSPGTDKEVNWLPAPPARFSVMLRLYWPDLAAWEDGWRPPPLQQVRSLSSSAL